MENKSMNKTIKVIAVVLLFACFCLTIFQFANTANQTAYKIIENIMYAIACIAGLVYVLYGCKKDVAKYYKLFLLLFSFVTLLNVVTDLFALKARNIDSSIFGVLGTAICVIAMVLTFAKDLGKSNSMGLAYAMLALCAANSITTFVLCSNILGPTVSAAKNLIMVIIGFLFVIEKYNDKESRGAK